MPREKVKNSSQSTGTVPEVTSGERNYKEKDVDTSRAPTIKLTQAVDKREDNKYYKNKFNNRKNNLRNKIAQNKCRDHEQHAL